MKNLKKILMALLLVALMVSAVATVAIAEASYTGSVAEAELLLNEAIAASGDVATVKTEPLKKLYEYLLTVNPEDEGYDEVKESYNQMTFKVANHLYEKYEGIADKAQSNTLDNKKAIAEAITNVHLHIAAAPVIRKASENVLRSNGFECETCGRYRDFTPEEYYNGITDDIMCPGICTKQQQKLVYTADADKTYGYNEFEKKLNDVTLTFAADITAYLYGLTDENLPGTVTYYEVREARKVVLDYLANIDKKEYKTPESTVYTGDVSVAAGMIKNSGKNSTFAELKTALAKVYNYLVENPVNPMLDEFAGFLADYNQLGELLIEKLGAEVDACDDVDSKIEIMSDFRDYLNGTEGTQISEKVVNLFNAYRAEFIESYSKAAGAFAGLGNIDASVPKAVAYNSDFTEFNEALAAIEQDGTVTNEEIAVLYAFVSEGMLNPTAEAYAATIEKYVRVCTSYVKAEYVDKYHASLTVESALAIHDAFLAFIKTNPLCEDVTDAYIDVLKDMIGRIKAITDAVDLNSLPAFEEVKTEITSTIGVLNSLYSDVKSAYDAYQDAKTPAEAKNAALENAKTALAALGTYIEANGIDTAAEENSSFLADYNAIRANVATALLETVKAAAEDKKEEALAGVKEYFAAAPILTASIREYNALVAALVNDEDKKQALTLNNVYLKAYACIDAIADEEAGYESMIKNAEELAKCDKQYIDITDPEYADYVSKRNEAYTTVSDNIKTALPEMLKKATAEEYVEIIEEYISYANRLNVKTIIDDVNAILTIENATMNGHVQNLEEDPYRTESEKFLAEIKKFDAATTLDAKMEVFKGIFKKYYETGFMTTELMLDESFETIKNDYKRVCDELEGAIISHIKEIGDPNDLIAFLAVLYGYVPETPFSQAVIGEYADARAALEELDFANSAAKLEADCDKAEYVTPTNFSGYLARVNLALELAKKDGNFDEDKFKVAYNILSGKDGVKPDENGEYTGKPIDFGVDGLEQTLESLGEIKTIYKKVIADSFAGDDIEAKEAELEKLGEFVEKYPYSKAMCELYNSSCEAFASNYRKTVAEKTEDFKPLVDLLHDYLENCPVSTELLGTVEKSRYQTICTLAEISQLVVVEDAIDAFWDLPDRGDFNLIYENLAYDNINQYVEDYGLTDTSDSKIASAVMKYAFEEYLIKFIAELKNCDEETQNREIAYRGKKFASANFPSELITLYKSAFKLTDLKAVPSTAEKTNGNVVSILKKAEEIDITEDAATVADALTKLVSDVNSVNISNAGLLSDILASADAIKADIDRKTKEQIEFLETKSKIEEQSNPVLYNYDHESSAGFTGSVSGSGNPTHLLVSDGKNKYAEMTIHSGDSNCFKAVTIKDLPTGIVIEMDIMSPGDFSFQIEENNLGEVLFVFQNGVLQKEFSKYGEGAEDIKLVPTQWTHFTVIADCDAQTVEVLIDYVSVGTKRLNSTDRFKSLRVTSKNVLYPNEKGELKVKAPVSVNCYDNIKIYSGTSYRTLGKVMTIEEEFNNSVLSMLDESLSYVERARAYYRAYDRYDLVSVGCEENKAKFKAFDADALKRNGNEEALSAILELEKELNIATITTADVAATEQTVAKIKSKIELNRQVLNQTDENLLRVNKELIEANEKIIWLSNLSSAVEHLGRFHRATTLASVVKHYNLFKTYYDICELEKADNMAAAEKDPICEKFVKNVKGDEAVLAVLEEVTFDGYCHDYVSARIAAYRNADNSIKIIDCIGFIKTIAADEGSFESTEAYYEELVEQANFNYDYVESYLSIIRGVVKAEAYVDNEAEYPGISKAVEIFFLLDAEFSKILKNTHYTVIEEQLARYNATASYIEKAGICAFLENYIINNDVDLTDEKGVRYRTIIDVYKAELSVYIEDYESVLEANTEAFIATVEKMKTYVTYKELKPLYDEAMNNYYYSMNVDSDRARAAVETFMQYQEKILDWEENSTMFIGYVSNLKTARRQAQKYRALVNCMNCIDGISEDVKGVAAALKTYNEGLAEYNESILPVNNEISEASDVVCSVRTHSVPATILAIFKNLMNK